MSTTDTLLLNITTQLADIQREIGNITARLDHGAKTHEELKRGLENVDHRTRGLDIDMNHVVKPMATKIEKVIEPQLKKHGQVLGRFAAVLGIASTVMFGVVNLVWWGLTSLWPTVMDLLRGKGQF
jgi:hypothetical protein